MTNEQFETLRHDIAFYACVVCSIASTRFWVSALFFALAMLILIFGKLRYKPDAAEGKE